MTRAPSEIANSEALPKSGNAFSRDLDRLLRLRLRTGALDNHHVGEGDRRVLSSACVPRRETKENKPPGGPTSIVGVSVESERWRNS